MNKSLLIIGGLILAAAAGYFLRAAAGGPPFQQTYQLCFYNCENAHTEKMNAIYENYDRCVEDAQTTLDNSVCSTHTIEIFQNCRKGHELQFKNTKAACLKTRNEALTAEKIAYKNCKEICQPNWEVALEREH